MGHLVPVFFVTCCLLLMLSVTECAFRKRANPQQKLLNEMFDNYDSNALSYNVDPKDPAKSTGVKMTFSAKLVRIIGVNERGNSFETEWWVQQHWSNEDLSWNASEYGGVKHVYVSPGRVWTPDILLYNSASDNGRSIGGSNKSMPHVRITSEGHHSWYMPARFKSTCEANTRYFPFDDQVCKLEFGSWAFDASQLDLTVDNNTGINKRIYQANTEWELLDFHFFVEQVEYPGLPNRYPKVVLEVHLRRRHYYYLFNLVLPCSFIAVMVLLSFILPPESGERISLGITVLMAMVIFQELTSQKLPVESKFIPLLAQYYSTAIVEIGLAIFANSIILNFHYRKNKMPRCLRKFLLSYIGPMVGIKLWRNLQRSTSQKNNNRNNPRSNGNCELKTMKLIESETVDTELRECEQNVSKETRILNDQENTDFDEHGDQTHKDPKAIEANSLEWQKAAQILDRLVLAVILIFSVISFGAIFIQAPRVREAILGTSKISLEEKIFLSSS